MQTKKLSRFLIACLLLIVQIGCEDSGPELQEEQISRGTRLVASPDLIRGAVEDFPGLSELLKTQIKDKVLSQKDNALYDFKIIESAVSQISWEEDFHYTFPLIRESGEEETLENLVISNRDGFEPRAYIVQYFPDEAYWEALASNPYAPLTGGARIIPLDIDQLELSGRGCSETTTITTTYCTYEGHEDNELGPDVAGPACTETVTVTQTVTIDAECSSDGGTIFDLSSLGGSGTSTSTSDNTYPEPATIEDSSIFLDPMVQGRRLAIKLNLSSFSDEWDWVFDPDNTNEMLQSLSFVEQNNDSEDAKSSAKEILTAYTNGTIISAFPFVKYPKDKAELYKDKYPKFTNLLENGLFKLANNDKIVDAIFGLTEAPKEIIKQALQWGEGPEIIIEQLGTTQSGDEKQGTYRGHLFPNQLNKLFIDIDLVNDFENTSNPELSNALGFLLAVTVLHEYTHLADVTFGGEYWSDLFLSEGGLENEAGVLFEEEVFGQRVERENAGIVLKSFNF